MVIPRIPILGYLSLGLAGACLILFALWQMERAHSSKVERRAELYRSELVRITGELEAANNRIAAELRRKHDEETRRIAGAADDLRVSGPGRARASCPPAAASGHSASGGAGDVARPEMPSGDSATVPWQWLVSRAEAADLNRSEVIAWREWHARFTAEWETWQKARRSAGRP